MIGIAAISTVLGLLALVVALAEVGRRSTVPYPTLMVVAGLVIGALSVLVPGVPTIGLAPELVFLVFLPPVLYAAAWNTSWHDFARARRPIALLAIGLVLVTTGAVAFVVRWLVPGMPWSVAFVLGAIVSPPDAAAATAICERLKVPSRIVSEIEGESLVNDSTGLIAYKVAVAAVVTGQFSWGKTMAMAVGAPLAGVLIGVVAGLLVSAIHHRFRDPMVATAMSLLAPYAAYLPAEMLHCSGVLATVAAGLIVSARSPMTMSAGVRLEAIPVWQVLILLINGFLFVLIGLQLRELLLAVADASMLRVLWYSLVVSVVVIATRVLWVFPASYLPFWLSRWMPRITRGEARPPWRNVAVVSWTGMRGIVSLAAALAIPKLTAEGVSFPHRDLVIVLTFAVILSTLVLQSLTLPGLIRALRVEAGDEEVVQERRARVAAVEAAMARLDELERSGEAPPEVAMRVWEEYASRSRELELHAAEDATSAAATIADTFRTSAELQAKLRVASRLIEAERAAVVRLRDRGDLNDVVFRRMERLFDLAEAQLTEQGRHGGGQHVRTA